MRRHMLGWWVLGAVLALGTPALAHVESSSPVDVSATPFETLAAAARSLDGFGTLVAAVAVTMVLLARSRRAVAVACLALLIVVAFESGVHSVHHLTDQPDAQCVVASASAHVGGVAVTAVAFEGPAEAIAAVPLAPTGSPTARPAAPDLGRAPPLA